MRHFLKSKRFIAIACISAVLALSIVLCSVFGGFSALQSDFLASMFKPIQSVSSSIYESVSGFFENMQSNEELKKQVDSLNAQLADKDKKLAEYENAIRQNEFYKEFLGVKSDNPSFEFSAAMIIAKDTSDPYRTFTIDKGTLDGIKVYSPVITANGLVGYISDAYSTQSVVMTVFNPLINVSVSDNRTRDTGNICGVAEQAQDGFTVMQYVSSENTMASGDYVVTSGAGGVFPAGLIVGTVDEVRPSKNAVSCYATIKPTVDFDRLSDVMVITDFKGKAN